MGMDLAKGSGIDFFVNVDVWRQTLGLARCFGWKPSGTIAPELFDQFGDRYIEQGALLAEQWPSGYLINDWHRVTDADAEALAEALYRIVKALRGKAVTSEQHRLALAHMPEKLCPALPFGPRQRIGYADQVREIADYVAKGGFVIG